MVEFGNLSLAIHEYPQGYILSSVFSALHLSHSKKGWIFSQKSITHYGWEKFQTYGVEINGKCIYDS